MSASHSNHSVLLNASKIAYASLSSVGQRSCDPRNDPLRNANGSLLIFAESPWWADKSSSGTCVIMPPQWRSDASVKIKTEQFSRCCANVTRSCKTILFPLHEFSHLSSHFVFEIAFAEAARLVRRVTPWRKYFSRSRRDTTPANSGKWRWSQFVAARKCWSSRQVSGRRRISKPSIRAGSWRTLCRVQFPKPFYFCSEEHAFFR